MTRPLTLIAVLALSACGFESGAVTITNVYLPFDLADFTSKAKTPYDQATCVLPKIDSLLMRSATGSLDALAPQLEVATFLQANLTPSTGLFVGGIELEAANTDQPVLNQKVLSYPTAKSTDSSGLSTGSLRPKQAASDMFLKFTVGSSIPTIAITGEELISTGLGGMQEALATVTGGDSVTATVLLEYRGYMSRTGAAISTGAIAFPIRMEAAGNCLVRNKAVGICPAPGQFGGPPACCDEAIKAGVRASVAGCECPVGGCP